MRNKKNSIKSNVRNSDTHLQRMIATNPLQDLYFAVQSMHSISRREAGGWTWGCGIGLKALLLAKAVGPGGHVTGVDLSPEFLVYARSIAEKAGISEQVSFQEGDMNNLQFDDDTFDWVWSANTQATRQVSSCQC